MIEKKDEVSLINDDINEPITLDEDPVSASVSSTDITVVVLAESRQLLEQSTAKLQGNIEQSFARLLDTLKYREKQLLRQVDVHHNQQLALLQSSQPPAADLKNGAGIPELSVNLEAEPDLVETILSYGKVQLGGGSLVASEGNTSPFSVPYKLEDYQDATHDHVSLYKPLAPPDDSATHQVIKFGFAPKLNLSKTSTDEETSQVEEESADTSATEPKNEDDPEGASVKERRPSQVQQWLQQILAETETEPTVGEVAKNFEDMSPS